MNLAAQKWKGLFNQDGSKADTPRLVRVDLSHKQKGFQGFHRVSSPTSPPIIGSSNSLDTPKLLLDGNVPILNSNEIMDLMDEVAEEIDHQYDNENHDDSGFIPKKNQVEDIRTIFQYDKQLGSGATSRVLKARRLDSGRLVAVKEIEKSKQNYESFTKERELLRKLCHPNILKYRDCYEDDKCYYIETDFCCGGTMLDRICKMGSFSEKKASENIRPILAAISYMHSLDIVHRDLKCQNLVFDKRGSAGRLQVIDFGESMRVFGHRQYNEFVGTIHYIPPEIIRTRSAAEMKAGDCWSIGIVAFILVTGRPPFGGRTQEEILRKITAKDRTLSFPRNIRLTASCKSFIRGLLTGDPQIRLTAELALKHRWISGHGASTADLCPSYLQSLKQYNDGNKLQNIMVHALLSDMKTEDQKEMNEGLLKMTRFQSQMRDKDVMDFLLLHSKVTERAFLTKGWTTHKVTEMTANGHKRGSSYHFTSTEIDANTPTSGSEEDFKGHSHGVDEDQISEVNAMDFVFAAHSRRKPENIKVFLKNEAIPEMRPVFERKKASDDDILQRRMSPSRFHAILKSTPYDVDGLIDKLQDDDGMIPLDQIADYDLQSEDECLWNDQDILFDISKLDFEESISQLE